MPGRRPRRAALPGSPAPLTAAGDDRAAMSGGLGRSGAVGEGLAHHLFGGVDQRPGDEVTFLKRQTRR